MNNFVIAVLLITTLILNGCAGLKPPLEKTPLSVETIRLGLSPAPQLRLSITDTGSGIPPKNMTKLFDSLFTTKAKGIGLGLAVSKNLVETNGGSIEVESEEGQSSLLP